MTELTSSLYKQIKTLLIDARSKVKRSIDSAMVHAYFDVGRLIFEDEQKGQDRANYGQQMLGQLSDRLQSEFGKGFSLTNLKYMRMFYIAFRKGLTLSDQLSWSHYVQLIRLDDESARNFYMNEAINEKWSVRELDRQINSMLFERLALSKNKEAVKKLSAQGQVIAAPGDMVKDPYILEFLGWPESATFSENDFETALIDNLQHFLLERGKGFSFVSRQQRITLDNEHFYIDLIFYNRLLRSFVLIDLKIGKLTHQDLGQMQMYVNYYDRDIKDKDENKTIDIVLCRDKKEIIAKYTLPEANKTIFASKYKTYLPTEEELKQELEEISEYEK